MTPLMKANASETTGEIDFSIPEPNPANYTCFSADEIKSLATYNKSCDVCKLDLNDTRTTLEKCVDHGAPATAWWADPKIVIGGFAISIGVGALIGVALSK